MSFINLINAGRRFYAGEVAIDAVKDCTFSIERGELAVILGQSGAGKTTVLNLLGGMDTPTSGIVQVDGENLNTFSRKQLIKYRRLNVGFVFQFYNLIGNLNALENVELACQISPDALDPAEVLEKVGLKDRLKSFPAQLSGGEQQRVAIARAIAKNPKLLLCDEPTGALDSETGQKVLSLIKETCKNYGKTTVIITHNSAIAEIADKVIQIKNGTSENTVTNPHPKNAEEILW